MKRGHTDSVPIHHNTFVNSLDVAGEPERVLREAMKRRGYDDGRVLVEGIGEQRVLFGK